MHAAKTSGLVLPVAALHRTDQPCRCPRWSQRIAPRCRQRFQIKAAFACFGYDVEKTKIRMPYRSGYRSGATRAVNRRTQDSLSDLNQNWRAFRSPCNYVSNPVLRDVAEYLVALLEQPRAGQEFSE